MGISFWKKIVIIFFLVLSYIIIFHREYIFSLLSMTKQCKIVVFDLDETLGCFVELGMFWDALNSILGKQHDSHFNDVLDLYPEFLRPKIIKILKYVLDRKHDGSCNKIMIYTNNQGPKTWAQLISKYFNYKTGKKVFDQIIAAFKIRGEVIELCRTSHQKSVSDLFKCTKIPKNTQICFLDDVYHPMMENDNVYYINVKPYHFSMPYSDMAIRYYEEFNPDMDYLEFISLIQAHMKRYNYTVSEKGKKESDVDEIISKQIIRHLSEFFKSKKRHTIKKKRRHHKKRGTRKSRNKH